jgi:tetratricopeptide (TPR) repeat protein
MTCFNNSTVPAGRHLPAALAFLCIALSPMQSQAAPYQPASDDAVLATVPAGLRTATVGPRDLQSAVAQASSDIESARSTGDPRYLGYAQSALGRWWSATDAPLSVILIRAQIHQHNHAFEAALADLDHALILDPRNAQARLTRAAIHQVQGNYAAAAMDCRSLALLVEPLVTVDCMSRLSSVRGDARRAYEKLVAMRDRAEGLEPRRRREIELTLADISNRLGELETARQHYDQALSATAADAYTLLTLADFLLEQHDYDQVTELFERYPDYADLLLRAALASQATHAATAGQLSRRLSDQYAAHQRRGDFVPSRDYARFLLDVEGKASAALDAALTNWKSQREPADALIVVRAAIAAGRPRAATPVLTFVREHGLEDVRLVPLLAKIPQEPRT